MACIANLAVCGDKYPQTRFPYWHVKANAVVQNATFSLMSNCNESHEQDDYNDFSEYVKALVCQVFNHDIDIDTLHPVQDVAITFTHKSYGKQSEMRYMNPRYEGYVKLTITSDGIRDEHGFNILKKFDLKFFIIGYHSQEEFENSAKSLLSPLALKAWEKDFQK